MKRFAFVATMFVFGLFTALVACGPSSPNLVGKWDGTGPESFHCVLDISQSGDNLAIRTQNLTPGGSGRCDSFDGNYTMTKEGNLARGSEGVVLSFDKTKNQLSNFEHYHEWLVFAKTQ
jgi:hypothetical protein